MTADTPRIVDAALAAVHDLHTMLGEDPLLTYVAAMTSAAIAGHMIDRTPEQMHETLDKVRDAALAAMLRVTETPQ